MSMAVRCHDVAERRVCRAEIQLQLSLTAHRHTLNASRASLSPTTAQKPCPASTRCCPSFSLATAADCFGRPAAKAARASRGAGRPFALLAVWHRLPSALSSSSLSELPSVTSMQGDTRVALLTTPVNTDCFPLSSPSQPSPFAASSRPSIPILTGLRGLLALWILLHNYRDLGPAPDLLSCGCCSRAVLRCRASSC